MKLRIKRRGGGQVGRWCIRRNSKETKAHEDSSGATFDDTTAGEEEEVKQSHLLLATVPTRHLDGQENRERVKFFLCHCSVR